jgi:hypothetical protein
MAEGYLLSEEDRNKLKKLLSESNTTWIHNDPLGSMQNTPEVYIAKVQPDGTTSKTIPALKIVDNEWDHPGCAPCDIYQITTSTTSEDWDIVPISGRTIPVYNLTASDIQNDWFLVIRDKSGRWIAAQSGSSLTPGFLYDDAVPDATGINMHPAKIESGSWVADTDADKILVDNTHPGTFRGYGSNHSGFSATTAAKVWVTPGPGGNPVIVCGKGLAKRCKCQLTATLTATTASCTVDNVTATDSGQSPTASSSTTMTVYIQLNPSSSGGYAGADNTVCYIEWHEDDDKWYIYDMPCSA